MSCAYPINSSVRFILRNAYQAGAYSGGRLLALLTSLQKWRHLTKQRWSPNVFMENVLSIFIINLSRIIRNLCMNKYPKCLGTSRGQIRSRKEPADICCNIIWAIFWRKSWHSISWVWICTMEREQFMTYFLMCWWVHPFNYVPVILGG